MRHQVSQLLGVAPAVPFAALANRPWWIVLVLAGGLALVRQLAEWQRRRTLVALVERAPLGTVVEQERGMGGPGMRVQVGKAADAADEGTEDRGER